MQAIKDFVFNPERKIIKEFVCDGCGELVQQTEMIIPIGPLKGKKTIADYGCKCEDIQLVKETMEQAKKNKIKRLHRIFDHNSLINKSLKTATFRTYKPPTSDLGEAKIKLMEYAKEFKKDESSNLLLVGDYGVGKSHLAVAITKELMQKGVTCLFLSVPKLLTKIRQTYSGNTGFNEADILNLIESVDLFVLDDLGTEYTNLRKDDDNWTHTKLFEVLDSRSGKPTIYTTNLTGEQLKEKVNSRNLSRMMDGTEVIEMEGPDYRMRGFRK
ncbi:ATP-binding protein [Pseudogracilibacillus auburnensis]|uniref:ATP-binding protein n=1 Tax=Pseudogracilibacillus auburnensis TaxID=1494959 RepID=UPI001A956F88|nr:ATP-binding protein [Pseudogracilibacillus auburnensis]MBO1005636.1 ATP-binding protein [Pseudogracilibacillus auburnensis]